MTHEEIDDLLLEMRPDIRAAVRSWHEKELYQLDRDMVSAYLRDDKKMAALKQRKMELLTIIEHSASKVISDLRYELTLMDGPENLLKRDKLEEYVDGRLIAYAVAGGYGDGACHDKSVVLTSVKNV